MTCMPENPDRQSLEILAGAPGLIGFDLEFRIGKEEQQKLGLDVVPPTSEMEVAAARYRILFEYLAEKN